MAGNEDLHNPFGETKKKADRDVFDPRRRGDDSDPFKSQPDDNKWDEPDEDTSTRDA